MDYMIVPEGEIWCSRLPNAQTLHSICSCHKWCPSEHSLALATLIYMLTHVFCCVWSCRAWVVRQEDWTATEEPKDLWNILIYVWGSVQPTGDSPQNDFLTKAHKYLLAAPESLLYWLKENDTVLSVCWIYSSIVINIYIKCFNLPSSKSITKLQTTLLQGIYNLQWRDKKDNVSEKCHWGSPSLSFHCPSCHLLVHCHSIQNMTIHLT